MNTRLLVVSSLLATMLAVFTTGCSAEQCAALRSSSIGKVAIAAGSTIFNPQLVCGESSTDPGGGAGSPVDIQPGASVQSLMEPGGGCAPAAGEDTCTACTKAHCCAESAACLTDAECKAAVDCRIEAKGDGTDSSVCSTNAKLDAAIACLKESCASRCPGVL